MVQRCKQCGTKIIKFPIWRGQEKGEPFSWDKVIWINLIKIDLMTLMWLTVIFIMMFSYKHDIEQCKIVYEEPCSFCEKSNCCQVDWTRINPVYNNQDLPKFNLSSNLKKINEVK